MSSRDILQKALALPADERAVLASRLLDSLDSSTDGEIEAAWADEVQRRIAAYDRGELESISLEELAARLQQRRKSA